MEKSCDAPRKSWRKSTEPKHGCESARLTGRFAILIPQLREESLIISGSAPPKERSEMLRLRPGLTLLEDYGNVSNQICRAGFEFGARQRAF